MTPKYKYSASNLSEIQFNDEYVHFRNFKSIFQKSWTQTEMHGHFCEFRVHLITNNIDIWPIYDWTWN